MLAVMTVLASTDASAQCGAKRSTCTGCHDGTRATLPSHDAWHEDHAFADLCPSCHGGRGDALDATAAHENLVEPLVNDSDTCTSCHGVDTPRFLDRYRSLQRADAGGVPTDSPATPAKASKIHGERGPNEAMTIVLLGVGALGAAFVGLRERERNQAYKQGVS